MKNPLKNKTFEESTPGVSQKNHAGKKPPVKGQEYGLPLG